MAKNDYQFRQQATKQAFLDAGEKMGMQKMWDYVQMALTDPTVMSTHTLNKDRLKKVFEKLKELADYYHTAFTDDVEADVRQEEMDGVLREIWGGELSTFFERYPYVKEQSYKKGKRGWK